MPSQPRTGRKPRVPKGLDQSKVRIPHTMQDPERFPSEPKREQCTVCNGLGKTVHQTVTVGEYVADCPTCNGEGYVLG